MWGKVPADLIFRTWGLIKTNNEKIFAVKMIAKPDSAKASHIIEALTEGDKAFDQIKGVVDVVDITDVYYKGPTAVFKALGIKTISQILSFEEFGNISKAEIFRSLTRGERYDGDGNYIPDAASYLLKGLPIAKLPLADELKILEKEYNPITGEDEYKDIRAIEEKENIYFNSNERLAKSAGDTARSAETTSGIGAHSNMTQAAVDSVIRELELIDLTKVLNFAPLPNQKATFKYITRNGKILNKPAGDNVIGTLHKVMC